MREEQLSRLVDEGGVDVDCRHASNSDATGGTGAALGGDALRSAVADVVGCASCQRRGGWLWWRWNAVVNACTEP